MDSAAWLNGLWLRTSLVHLSGACSRIDRRSRGDALRDPAVIDVPPWPGSNGSRLVRRCGWLPCAGAHKRLTTAPRWAACHGCLCSTVQAGHGLRLPCATPQQKWHATCTTQKACPWRQADYRIIQAPRQSRGAGDTGQRRPEHDPHDYQAKAPEAARTASGVFFLIFLPATTGSDVERGKR